MALVDNPKPINGCHILFMGDARETKDKWT
jgi:hypothetical protein